MPRNEILRDEEKPSDSISDISDSDTEMVTSSGYSNTDSRFHGEMFCDSHNNNENEDNSNIVESPSFSDSSFRFSFSNMSAFHNVYKKQTTDCPKAFSDAENWTKSNIPISPPDFNNKSRSSQKLNSFDSLRSGNVGHYLYPGFTSMRASSTPNRQLPCPKSSSPVMDNDASMFLHSDVRIPFVNYFNNLVKLMHTAATRGQLGKSRNVKEGSKNLFNFYWNRETRGSDNTECCSSQICTSNNENYVSKTTSCDESLRMDDENSIRSQRRSQSATPPSFNMTGTSSESSPILSGHFPRDQICHQVSPSTQSLASLPHYVRCPGVRGPAYSTSGPYVPLPHPPYLPMPGYRYQRTNIEKSTPAKKYKCDVCGKAFSRSNTLVTHKRIHTGAKPFKCEICGRAFRQPGNLTRHRLTHTSVKPYVCPQCNKAFNRASNLNTHMRTHSNYRHYSSSLGTKGLGGRTDQKTPFLYSTKRVSSMRH